VLIIIRLLIRVGVLLKVSSVREVGESLLSLAKKFKSGVLKKVNELRRRMILTIVE
jgi:hypothetical protein